MSPFITLEGPDGSGKSSQAEKLVRGLRAHGFEVLHTREPGGTPISEQIRHVLMSLENTAMNARTEFLLFSAARAQHVAELIRPQLEQGSIVICDRFFDASLAYQGYGHELDLDALRAITLFATAGLIPDLTFLLDLPVEQGLIRREQDGQWNRLDAYDVAFHRRVRAGYLQLAAADPSRWVVIDAAQPPEPIHETIMEAALTRIRSTPH